MLTGLVASAVFIAEPYKWRDLYAPANISNFMLVASASCATFVALQTLKEIKRQANIAQSVVTLQFRPKVRVRKLLISETDDTLSIGIVVFNKGGTSATIAEGRIEVEWIYADSPKSPIATANFEPTVLRAGEQKHLKIVLNDDWIMFKFSEHPEYSSRMRLRCEGTIVYTDANGTERRTGFSRLRNAVSGKWDVDSDNEFEYAD